MSRRNKLRQRIRQQPANTAVSDLETLLVQFGFELVRVSGSHRVYRYNDDSRVSTLVVPVHGRRIKTVYVQQAIALLDSLFPEDLDEEGAADADE